MIIFLKLLVWLVPIGLNVMADATGRKPNYLAMGVLRGVALILYMLLWVPGDRVVYRIVEWLPYVPIVVYCLTSFWILFELFLNLIYNIREGENRSLLYFDQKEGDSGWIDRFFAGRPQLHTVAKIIALVLMIISIFLIYKIHGN